MRRSSPQAPTGHLSLLCGALAAATLLGAGCGGHGHGHSGSSIPRFHEVEPNDSVSEADDFGTLFPGERFVIEGTLPLSDPFDGFAFRSSEPLVVAFSLWVHDPWAEVRVGLYDVGLGETVAYWYQDHDEVHGELDVFYAGVDFHLFVEPLVGDTAYDLEIESFRAYGATAAAARPAGEAASKRALASRSGRVLDGEERAAGERYAGSAAVPAGGESEKGPHVLGRGFVLLLDEDGRAISRDELLFTAGGSWMGKPGAALVE